MRRMAWKNCLRSTTIATARQLFYTPSAKQRLACTDDIFTRMLNSPAKRWQKLRNARTYFRARQRSSHKTKPIRKHPIMRRECRNWSGRLAPFAQQLCTPSTFLHWPPQITTSGADLFHSEPHREAVQPLAVSASSPQPLQVYLHPA